MPRPNRQSSPAPAYLSTPDSGLKFDFASSDEPTTGDLTRDPDEVIPPGQSTPVDNKPKRKRRTKAEIDAERNAALNKEPDESLVETCAMATDTIADVGVDFLKMSEPGDEWRLTMARLAARWMDKFEHGDWFKSHPIEAQMILHAGYWIVPNACAIGFEKFKEWRSRREERRKRQRDQQEHNATMGQHAACLHSGCFRGEQCGVCGKVVE